LPAEFREVLPDSGFDDQTPTGGAGIVIPHKSANVVMLDGGKDLKVVTVMKPMLDLDEIKDRQYHHAMVDMQHPGNTPEKVLDLVLLKSGSLRVFKITGNSLVGIGKAKIQAIHPRTKKAEATLKVIVLKQKRVKISILPVQVRDDQGKLVNSSSKPIDPQVLLNQMNRIWKPQANIVFELCKTDPVTIERLRPGAPADITNEGLKAQFIAKKDRDADFTLFMLKRALNGTNVVNGVTNAEEAFALISDDRSENTMAHEAGHFLGSLNESGKFSMRYGHQGTDPKLLMRDGGAGSKIPFSIVTDFNKGYRA
jgi:hypothetical protein